MFHPVFMPRVLLLPVLMFILGADVTAVSAQDSTEPASDMTVSVLTILPGDLVYSAFGHTALRIQIPSDSVDHVYNFGTFDPDDRAFYSKFAMGRLDYRLSRTPFGPTIEFYYREGRPIIEQSLNLLPRQARLLAELLRQNYLPENRYYRYDFFFDNCSTRPRDLIELLFGEDFQIGTDETSGQTFRQLIDSYMKGHRLVDFGMDLALGDRADREATRREATFLPLVLMEELGAKTLATRAPFVSRTDTLFWFDDSNGRPMTIPWVQLALWIILIAVVGRVVLTKRRTGMWKSGRWADVLLYGLVGIAGFVVITLWFFSEHVVTPRNWNLAWAWPTHLLGALTIALNARWQLVRFYWLLTTIVVLLTLGAWPFLPQSFHPALVPLLLLIALRSALRASSNASPSSGSQLHTT